MFFSTGETLFFPSVERLNFLYAYRPGTSPPVQILRLGLHPAIVTPSLTLIFMFLIPMSIPSKTNNVEEAKPLVEGEGSERGQDREVNVADSDIVSEDGGLAKHAGFL